jgi:hypothetical protein
MSNFIRVRTSGAWTDGSTVLATEITALDANQVAAIDAVRGGCWAPTSPIIFGGSAVHTISGPVVVTGSTGKLTTQLGRGARFHLGFGIFYQLGPGHDGANQQVLETLASATGQLPMLRTSSYAQPIAATVQNTILVTGLTGPGGLQVAPSIGARLVKEIRGWNGGTLSQVVIKFQPSFAHTATPTTMPKARILRMGHTDLVPTPLTSTDAGADGDGYVTFPTPTGSWGPSIGVQQWTIPCDQNNAIDISQYAYFVDIQDEVTATVDAPAVPAQMIAPCRLATAVGDNVLTAQGLAPYGSLSFDGTPTANTDRVLITQSATPGTCGPWIASASGAWSRTGWALPSASPTIAPPVGSLVYVYDGETFAATVMQLTSIAPAVPGWTVDVADTGSNEAITGLYTLDGVALQENAGGFGTIVWLRSQTIPGDNGIYAAQSGAWVKLAPQTTLTFTSGSSVVNPSGDQGLVFVKSGPTNGGKFFRTIDPGVGGGVVQENGLTSTFAPWKPTGSLWFSARCYFVGITDTRWP